MSDEKAPADPGLLPPSARGPDPVGSTLPRADRPSSSGASRARVRRLLVRSVAVVFLGITIWTAFDRLVTSMLASTRQEHLSADFQTPRPTVSPGEAFGVIQAPAIALNAVVIEGASVDRLRSGPARMTSSALPGDAGLLVIAGHRRAFGAPFEHLVDLTPGSYIVVQARSGPIVQYVVDRVERHAEIADVDLGDDPKTLSVLVLVTDERNGDDQTIVVARALPVTDTVAVIPNLSSVVDLRGIVGMNELFGAAAVAGAAATWGFLRPRASTGVRVAAVSPLVLFGLVQLLLLFDSMLSPLR